ncbi:VCBS repeat-containing protein [Larkinella humicola]|uniref:VCBS repeat-containing protein n=1 Tax=Larkinella humicola TaxID=2607654 RepID=A0A5N1JPL4_9BACT|nr:VCBS repeat-containing protein [Larkinella humicola]
MFRQSFRCLVLLLLGGSISSCQLSNQSLFSLLPAEETGIAFSNQMTESDTLSILNVDYFYNGGGAAIGDFNNDGLQDVFFTGNLVANKLYLNKGDFKFTDITGPAGVGGNGKWCSGVALVDINNDGLMDIYVTATIRKTARDRENLLYVNQGVGAKDGIPVFKEMAREYGINDDSYTTNAAFFDYDNDGDLDLFVLTNMAERFPNAYHQKLVDGSSPTTDRLYRNDFDAKRGHPVFTDVSKEAGIQLEGYGLGLNICDINRDGWKDIYITNDFLSEDHFFINNQKGGFGKPAFTDQAGTFFKHTSQTAMGNDVTDLNNDGWMDIVALDMLPNDNFRKKMFIPPNNYQTYLNNEEFKFSYQYMRNTLQLNQGFRPGTREPVFSEISLLSGIAATDWSWTPMVVDFDHDGYRDIVVTNGFPKDVTDRDFMQYYADNSSVATRDYMLGQIPVIKINNYAFKNSGADLAFSDVTGNWGLTTPAFSGGAAYGDLDNDGDLDMVINNIDDPAFVYRNNLVEQKPEQANYLRVKFKGSEQNRMGLGAFVELRYGKGQQQIYEHTIYRGYLSTMENAAHFGLGAAKTIDEVRITWPAQNGNPGKTQTLRNVKANQVLMVDVKNATETAVLPPTAPAGRLFRDVTDSLKIQFVHQEPEYIDYNQQKLLPHKLSQYGPALSAGDVNGDGLDDLFIGGSRTQKGSFLLQTTAGKLVPQDLLPGTAGAGKPEEDMGTLLFDADGDGDLDLYVASGGFEEDANTASYQDRLYVNDGKGRFTLTPQALPQNRISKSCVKAADYDRDGDLDLFVGGRVVPNQYPRPVSSFILRNDSKPGLPKFTDVTKTVAPELQNIGLVCDALWTDTDNDGWPDLMLAGEWMPLTILKNVQGKKLSTTSGTQPLNHAIAQWKGWWNSLVAADFDQDGDMDYIAGNLGLNTLAQASPEEPWRVYAKDFDNNGFYDAIPTVFFSDEKGERREFPFNGREDLIKQIISMRARFPLHKDFAVTSIDKVFKEEELKGAIVLEANYMKSAYVENKGDGTFELHALPIQAQTAPLFGMIADDFDQDGFPDVLLVGNDFSNELLVGRLDALNGLLLKGNGKGGFTALNPGASGFYVPGNAKGLVRLSGAGRNGEPGKSLIVATQNRGPLKVFHAEQPTQTVPLKPTDVSANLVYAGGKKQKVEFYYGQSFLSQSARELTIGKGLKSLEIIDSRGNKRLVQLQTLAGK